MITMLQEITDWGDAPVKNGVYHVNDHDQLVAYHAPMGKLKEFANPMKGFSRARRKFVVLDTYEEDEDESIMKIPFESSKGDKTYYVTVDGTNIGCTCPGWKWKGKCKHVTSVINDGA